MIILLVKPSTPENKVFISAKECHCILLHTDTSFDPYILVKDESGLITRVEGDGDDSENENRVKFTRIFRLCINKYVIDLDV